MNNVEKRTLEFKRNPELEDLLKEVNFDLCSTERYLLQQEIQEYPVIFIMGAMRCGSTLMEQWLASTGLFAYPSNIISRFYGAPIIGSKIQKLLFDPKYNFRDEIMSFHGDISFESNNGKTKGSLEPNEFWYFWRRFLPDDLREYTSKDLLESVDIETFRRELWGVAQIFDKPIALKGMICNYHIPFLNTVFPKALFICIKRNLEKHTRSVLEARKRQFGTYDTWYSFLIPEYEELIQISDPEIQVRKQIECINHAIEKGLDSVPPQKKIQIEYETFCMNPPNLYFQIQRKLENQKYEIEKKYTGIKQFQIKG